MKASVMEMMVWVGVECGADEGAFEKLEVVELRCTICHQARKTELYLFRGGETVVHAFEALPY
eukprot:scaffold1362_cov163-Amphora_coffeaeformis.AAC.20